MKKISQVSRTGPKKKNKNKVCRTPPNRSKDQWMNLPGMKVPVVVEWMINNNNEKETSKIKLYDHHQDDGEERWWWKWLNLMFFLYTGFFLSISWKLHTLYNQSVIMALLLPRRLCFIWLGSCLMMMIKIIQISCLIWLENLFKFSTKKW